MAKSRTNPDRKQRVDKFKNQEKAKVKAMGEKQDQLKQLKQIQQRPYWNSNAQIVLSGVEYEAMLNVVNLFRDGVAAAETSLQRNIQSGVVKMRYFDQDGAELSTEEVDQITKQYQEYYENIKKQQEENKAKEESKPLILTGKEEPSDKPSLLVV